MKCRLSVFGGIARARRQRRRAGTGLPVQAGAHDRVLPCRGAPTTSSRARSARSGPRSSARPWSWKTARAAGATIGADAAAKSAPDGYTMLMAAGAHTLARAFIRSCSYDIVKDFAPISICARSAYLLVLHPSVPAKSSRS